MDKEKISYQYTPTAIHSKNMTQREIQTSTNHFISGFSSLPSNFPMNIWYWLFLKEKLTMNLLCISLINPRLSAYVQVHGVFDYNSTPVASHGIPVQAHVRSDTLTTWDSHVEDGFYIEPYHQHYRYHHIFITKICAECIINELKWLPHNNLRILNLTQEALIIVSLKDLDHESRSRKITPDFLPAEIHKHFETLQKYKIFSKIMIQHEIFQNNQNLK